MENEVDCLLMPRGSLSMNLEGKQRNDNQHIPSLSYNISVIQPSFRLGLKMGSLDNSRNKSHRIKGSSQSSVPLTHLCCFAMIALQKAICWTVWASSSRKHSVFSSSVWPLQPAFSTLSVFIAEFLHARG